MKKKILYALLPAIFVHVSRFILSWARFDQGWWEYLFLLILIIGGFISAKYITDWMKEKNVDRSFSMTAILGSIVIICYVAVFFVTSFVLGLIVES